VQAALRAPGGRQERAEASARCRSKRDIKVLPVSEEWAYSPGRRVRAIPRRLRTTAVHHIGPAVPTGVGLAGFGVGMAFYLANDNDAAPEDEDSCSCE